MKTNTAEKIDIGNERIALASVRVQPGIRLVCYLDGESLTHFLEHHDAKQSHAEATSIKQLTDEQASTMLKYIEIGVAR
jgi:hypothetical protein